MSKGTIGFDGQVVVVTNGSHGCGKGLASSFAARGASVFIHDEDVKAANAIAESIRQSGGTATACRSGSAQGDVAVDEALEQYGAVHVLINNMTPNSSAVRKFGDLPVGEWDAFMKKYNFGTYKVTRAAWPLFKKQKFGRIVNTVGASALSGQEDNAEYAAIELGMVGFTETLAKEGVKYNILSNLVMVPQHLQGQDANLTIGLISLLSHRNSATTKGLFESNGRAMSRLKWERSQPYGLRADSGLTVSAVLANWADVGDFASSESDPDGPWDAMEMLERSYKLPANTHKERAAFNGKVAVVTGAGNGLGQQYALKLGLLGARVVVNDLADPQKTVDMIRAAGETAVPDQHSVEEGDKVIETALRSFGGIHILINNAGILRDKSFQAMTDDLWNKIQSVHLHGTFATARAAWPHFVRQKYGRIINTTSVSGIYGNFGQSNYAMAKCATIGLSSALATEGRQYNIRVNTIGPSAGTQLTRTIMPEEIVQALKPDYVAPFTIALLSDELPASATNSLFEIGSGFIAVDRLRRSALETFEKPHEVALEDLQQSVQWKKLISTEISARREPKSKSLQLLPPPLENIEGNGNGDTIAYNYTEKDVVLYNLGIGAKPTDLRWVYEGAPGFEALPAFGVIPYFDPAVADKLANVLPNFSMKRVLHGEQYLEIRKFPIPVSGSLVTYPTIDEVIDKGNAAVVVTSFQTVDRNTGEDVFYNEQTIFVRGSGGFGGARTGKDRGVATAANNPPPCQPDADVIEKTSESSAAIYRLSGDFNPLHIDPETAKGGGLDKPILHGLCVLGISCKHVYSTFGPFRNVKVRFSGMTLPGQTLKTSMWRDGSKVTFQTSIAETGRVVLSAAAAQLLGPQSRL